MTKKKKTNGTQTRITKSKKDVINHKKVGRQTQTKNNLIFEKKDTTKSNTRKTRKNQH